MKNLLDKYNDAKNAHEEAEENVVNYIKNRWPIVDRVEVYSNDNISLTVGRAFCDFYFSEGRDCCHIRLSCPTDTLSGAYEDIMLKVKRDKDGLEKIIDEIFEELLGGVFNRKETK